MTNVIWKGLGADMIPDTLIVHCSMSSYGEIFLVDEWHKQRNFRMVGYHALILNGYPHRSKQYFETMDGQIQPGRKVWAKGAHCLNGYNSHSWGICMIGGFGERMFTFKQLDALKRYYEDMDQFLKTKYRKRLRVIGHCEGQSNKSCPDIPMDILRSYLKGEVKTKYLIDAIQADWDER